MYIFFLLRCYSDMETSILSINPETDTSVVVVENKTGFAFPKEHTFEDLGWILFFFFKFFIIIIF